MGITRRQFALLAAGGSLALAPWSGGLRKRPVSGAAGRHTIHTYFNVSPESPDGRYVLYYTSTTREAYAGEIRIQERATGKETVLVRNLDCEDAHRVACQQWVSGGRRVLFHDMRNGEVVAATVDIATGKERIHCKGRMVSWGLQNSDWAPVYGVHFQPGHYRDAEVLNVATGEIRIAARADNVRKAFSDEVRKIYGDSAISLPFGALSPDGKLIFFKLAAPSESYRALPEGQLKWPRGYQSNREGLVVAEVATGRLLSFRERWGHPAWHPDSRAILNEPNLTHDAFTGAVKPIPGLPKFPGQHLSFSPDGKLFVTDTQLTPFGGAKGEWGVAVCAADGSGWTMIDRFRGDEGARSWRKNHPHPAFSADGKRIYYNVNSGDYTQLFVAECG